MRANLLLSFCAGFCLVGLVHLRQAEAAPFQNGDFETPDESQSVNSFFPLNFFFNGTNGTINVVTVPGWTSTTTAGGSTSEQNFLIDTKFEAIPHGNQALLFNGDGASATTLSQTFDTVAGLGYQVQFLLSAQNLGVNDTGETFQLAHLVAQASGAGNTAQSYLATGTPSDAGVFPVFQETYDFTAQSPQTTLTFTQTDGSNASPVLDDVQVQSVPEPTVVCGLTVGAIGLILRRPKRD